MISRCVTTDQTELKESENINVSMVACPPSPPELLRKITYCKFRLGAPTEKNKHM